MSVGVYREYYHFFFIPFVPFGPKSAKIWCHNCGAPFHAEAVKRHYENISRTPFYFYSFLILAIGFVLFLAGLNIATQKDKAAFIKSPKRGDSYTVRDSTNNYYFLKLVAIRGDSLLMLHNHFLYQRFTSTPENGDYFDKDDTLIYTQSKLQAMLDSGEIVGTKRE
ncbi:MAG: hypothetical protein JST39_05810 [Bacteroidetes bacterium]|nr:hypothetical protein [Bacteroidota bacterium]